MIGVLVNTAAIIVCGLIGLIAKKAIPESWDDIIIKGMGMVSIYIGVTGMTTGENILILVFSMVFGAMIGQGLDLDRHLDGLAHAVEKKFIKDASSSTFAQGLVTASLIFCVGAMTIMGPLNAALNGDNALLYTKAVMDGVVTIVLTASLGIGVIFSAVVLLIIEGGIFLLANFIEPYLSETVIAEMSCIGSVLILGLGLNLLGATKLKIINYTPGIFLPILLCPFYAWASGLF